MTRKLFWKKRKGSGKDPPWAGNQGKSFFVTKRHLRSSKNTAGIISRGQIYKRKEAII